MFGKRWHLFDLFGFKIQLDASWLLLAALVTWSLAKRVFPQFYPDLDVRVYWTMGIVGMVGLIVSIVLHEVSHALVGRRFGLPTSSITLFIFGGVAELTEEPRSARTEFWMALAGPAASGALAFAFAILAGSLEPYDGLLAAKGVFSYLATINGLLALFNLLPAFPLDGGRILRAALWHWKKDLRWATRTASHGGEMLGLGLIFLGLLNIMSGNFVGGIWWALIGLFVRQAASASYQQLLTRQVFEGAPVSRYMTRNPVSVSRELSLKTFVTDFVYRYHHDLFPVTRDGSLTGFVRSRDAARIPAHEWGEHRVATLAQACTTDNTIPPDLDVVDALTRMQQTGQSRLLVADKGRLVGIITLKDLLDLFAFKLDLEGLR